jgi:hypothetical protein
MAVDNLAVYNLALTKVGWTERITSGATSTPRTLCDAMWEDVRREVLSRLAWPFATRQGRLSEYLPDDWSSTVSYGTADRVKLAGIIYESLSTSVPVGQSPDGSDSWAAVDLVRIGWRHMYELPQDCVLPRAILAGGMRIDLLGVDQRVPYAIQARYLSEAEKQALAGLPAIGYLLLIDLAPDEFDAIEYTADIDFVPAWPPDFTDAVAWRMAVDLSLGLVQGTAGEALSTRRMQSYEYAVARAAANILNAEQRDPEPDSPSIRARR